MIDFEKVAFKPLKVIDELDDDDTPLRIEKHNDETAKPAAFAKNDDYTVGNGYYDDDSDDDKEDKNVNSSSENNTMTAEFFNILKEGINTLPKQIHKDRRDIKEEPTLWCLFKGAYGCISDEVSEEDVNDWLDEFRDEHDDKLTQSAKTSWRVERKRYRKEPNKGCGMLVQMLKYHHPEYYEQHVKYYKTHLQTLNITNRFDIFDDFDLLTIEDSEYSKKAKDDDDKLIDIPDYAKLNKDIGNIIRVVRTDGQVRFIYKDIRSTVEGMAKHRVRLIDDTAAEKLFKTVYLRGLPKEKHCGQMRYPTLWSYISNNYQKFRVKRCVFYDPHNTDTFNLFSGYSYREMNVDDDEINSKIHLHLKHWHDILCSGNDDQYNYLLNWCSYRHE